MKERKRRLEEVLVDHSVFVLMHEVLEVVDLALEKHAKSRLLVFIELVRMEPTKPPDADVAGIVEWREAILKRRYELSDRLKAGLLRVLANLGSQVDERRDGRDRGDELTDAPEVLEGHCRRLTDLALGCRPAGTPRRRLPAP